MIRQRQRLLWGGMPPLIRSNHSQAERRRHGFPKLGHCDTWLIDALQNLVLKNHGALLYPNWSNASDFRDTDESFGAVALHNQPLHDAVDAAYERIKKDEEMAIEEATTDGMSKAERKCAIAKIPRMKLTSDQKHIAGSMGVPIPFLPFHGEKEHKARARFLLDPATPKDDEARAIAWCELVDGIDVMPKLAVHFRNAAKQIERNERIKRAVRNARDASAMLSALNAATLQPAQEATIQAEDQSSETPNSNNLPGGFVAPRQHGALQPPIPAARAVVPTQIVGGTSIGTSNHSTAQVARRHGQRGNDAKKRAPRTCKNCKKYGGPSETCKGRGPRGLCQHFHEDGTSK